MPSKYLERMRMFGLTSWRPSLGVLATSAPHCATAAWSVKLCVLDMLGWRAPRARRAGTSSGVPTASSFHPPVGWWTSQAICQGDRPGRQAGERRHGGDWRWTPCARKSMDGIAGPPGDEASPSVHSVFEPKISSCRRRKTRSRLTMKCTTGGPMIPIC
jgi:hypothetical protein